MPYKNAEDRKAAARRASKKARSTPKPEGACTSWPGCKNTPEPGFKRCAKCLEYMRNYKKEYRKKEAPPGICSRYPDCALPTEGTQKVCPTCRAKLKSKEDANRPEINASHRERTKKLKEEFIAHYGGRCLCCGETQHEFLTADHIGGHKEGPRTGPALYAWVKKQGYPDTFRLLCMNCNFSLGHHGHCPHGNGLTQECKVGRPDEGVTLSYRREYRQQYYRDIKNEVFAAYGGSVCKCCGVTALEFLSIDHINNDGAAHRKEVNGNSQDGRNILYWLKNHGYPPGFQVLCHSCNFAKGHFGSCPHSRESVINTSQALAPNEDLHAL